MRKEDNPSLSLLTSPGHAAAEPGTSLDAGQDSAPGGGLDARYEQLRHAALHTRAEAFPLGLGVLARGGVTAWRHALAGLAPAGQGTAVPPGTAPGPMSSRSCSAVNRTRLGRVFGPALPTPGGHDLPNSSQCGNSSHPQRRMRAVQ